MQKWSELTTGGVACLLRLFLLQMILAAIEGLGDKNGSNKSAISKYIEGKYGELPPAHASLLTAHLARMKESGELIFVKNNYFRADAPDAPQKRGRGRPPGSGPPPLRRCVCGRPLLPAAALFSTSCCDVGRTGGG